MNTCVVALLAAAAVVVVSEAFSLESLVSKMMAESDDADTLERYRRDVNCSDHSQFGGPREFKKCCKKIPKIFRGGPPKHCHKSKGGPHHKGAPPGGPDGGPPPPSAPEKQMEGAGSPPPHRGPPDMDMHICKTEESFKNKSLINDDTGKVEIERVRIYMEEKLQDKSAEWKAPVDVALTKCEVEASKMVESGNHTCKSGAQELKICMERELFVNCPESFWKGGE
uniref:Uncharacterized protein n=1 Tax=Timema cristinae TaxID=61476 RepID=A0A7R9D423_TIMCR|nr:unnamed protein product [Timema cristinae]